MEGSLGESFDSTLGGQLIDFALRSSSTHSGYGYINKVSGTPELPACNLNIAQTLAPPISCLS